LLEVVDTHSHLDEVENLEYALSKAKESGVAAIISVGSNHQSNQKIMEICQNYSGFVYPALGLHPWELGKLSPNEIEVTLTFIEERISLIAAIGEIGLDYDKRVTKVASKELQKEILKRFLVLANKYAKPVSVHSRYAWKDTFELVKEAGTEKAVFHWFTGFSGVLKEILQANYFISATPAVEYHEEHRHAVKETPAERLLLETDCPVTYGRENKYRSQPADVLRSLRATAKLKNIDEPTLARLSTSNAVELFGL
jgi:TatD DNase family protein